MDIDTLRFTKRKRLEAKISTELTMIGNDAPPQRVKQITGTLTAVCSGKHCNHNLVLECSETDGKYCEHTDHTLEMRCSNDNRTKKQSFDLTCDCHKPSGVNSCSHSTAVIVHICKEYIRSVVEKDIKSEEDRKNMQELKDMLYGLGLE
jgi:hypothetical protein